MRKIADISALVLIASIVLLSIISILGVWSILQSDVLIKSFESIGLLAGVTAIVLVADHLIEKRSEGGLPTYPESTAFFSILRKATLSLLIVSVAFLALFGILAIWQVLSGDVLHKSMVSISIVVFSSLIIVLFCLEREGNPILQNTKISGWTTFLLMLLAWWAFGLLF